MVRRPDDQDPYLLPFWMLLSAVSAWAASGLVRLMEMFL